MAQIIVQVYTAIGNKLVKGKIQIEVSNVAEALESMEKHFGREFKNEVVELDGSIKTNYIVALNGYPIDRKTPDKVKFTDNDVLQIYPAISGG